MFTVPYVTIVPFYTASTLLMYTAPVAIVPFYTASTLLMYTAPCGSSSILYSVHITHVHSPVWQ